MGVPDGTCIGAALNQTAGLASGSAFPVGVTIVEYELIHVAQTSLTESFTVTVIDNEDPIITCSADQTQTTDTGVCEAAVTIIVPTTGDNCAVASITNNFNNTADASDTYPIGTTTVTWTVTDIHGNSNTCAQDITVTDDEAPIVTCVANGYRDTDPDVCTYIVVGTEFDATFTDNCTS